jgi:hypothetical protein
LFYHVELAHDPTESTASAFSRLIEMLGGKKRHIPPVIHLDPIVQDMAEYYHVQYQRLALEDPEFRLAQLNLLEETKTIASLPFGDQVKYGHYIVKKMLGEDEKIWYPWAAYMIDTQIPVSLKAKTFIIQSCGNLAYIMAHLIPTDPLWIKFATTLADIQTTADDRECERDANFKAVVQARVDAYVQAPITDSEFHRKLIMTWQDLETICADSRHSE